MFCQFSKRNFPKPGPSKMVEGVPNAASKGKNIKLIQELYREGHESPTNLPDDRKKGSYKSPAESLFSWEMSENYSMEEPLKNIGSG